MNKERWQRVAAAVETVLDSAESQRESALIRACEGSSSLERDVRVMLQAHAAVVDVTWRPNLVEPSVKTAPLGFDPRFTISDCLGEGGFGTVYRAWDNHLGRTVAIKRLRSENAEFLMRFKREFRALSELNHPGVVAVYELFVERNQAWFTMELIEGRPIVEVEETSSASWIQSEIWAERLRARFLQLAEAIGEAHDAGIIHRDLKPSNVLVSKEEKVTVLDFGLATDLRSRRDPHSMLCGTPLYMAPEQFGTRGALPESDWYAIGVMLYEALMHRTPFETGAYDLINQKSKSTAMPVTSPYLLRLTELAVALLDPNPNQRPSRNEIFRALGSVRQVSSIPKASALSASSHFVGRGNELLSLCRATRQMAKGVLSVVRIEGAAGSGKSALISRFVELAQAEDPSIVVLVGRCRENESLGFRAIDSVVDALSEYLKRLPERDVEALLPQQLHETVAVFPALRSVPSVARARLRTFADPGSEARRQSAFEGIRELLGRLAHVRPVVIVIDDLQWSDAESPALFRHLLSPPHAPPILLIVAHRGESQTKSALNLLITSMSDVASLEPIELDRLKECETRSLVNLHIGSDHPAVESIVTQSFGLPILVVDLCRYIQEVGQREHFEGWTQILRKPILALLFHALLPEARVLVELLSVAHRPLQLSLIGRAAHLSNAETAIALRFLRHHHLVTVTADGRQLEIYHDCIRMSLLALIDDNRQVELNRLLAHAIAEMCPFDHHGLLTHFRAANELQRASYHALFAAECFEKEGNFIEASRWLKVVLELEGSDESRRIALLRRLGNSLSQIGLGFEAASAYIEASSLLDPDSSMARELVYLAAEQLIRTGHIDSGLVLLKDRIAKSRFHIPKNRLVLQVGKVAWWLRSKFYSRIVFRARKIPDKTRLFLNASGLIASNAHLFDVQTVRYLHAKHFALTLESGEKSRVTNALGVEVMLSCLNGIQGLRNYHDALVKLESVFGIVDSPVLAASLPIWRGLICWLYGDFLTCFRAASEAEQRLLRLGNCQTWELANARALALASLAWQGQIREFRAQSTKLLGDAVERNDKYAYVLISAMAHHHVALLAADEPENVEPLFYNTDLFVFEKRWLLQDIWAFYGVIERCLYVGDVERGYELVAAAWQTLEKSSWMKVQVVSVFMFYLRGRIALAKLALAQNSNEGPRIKEAKGVVRGSIRALNRVRAPWVRGFTRILETALERLTDSLSNEALEARIETIQRGFESTHVGLFAFATRRALGVLAFDKQKGSLEQVDREARENGIVNPARFARMLAPELVFCEREPLKFTTNSEG